MKVRRRLQVLLVASTLGVAVAPVLVVAGAAPKPAGDVIASDLHVLTWHYPLVVSGGRETTGTKVVTNARVLDRVRALINALPVTVADPHRVCPDDMMLPDTVSFSVSRTTPAVSRVVFQLGGCPYAQVYFHGVKVSPTLGGAHLARTYAEVQRLISPDGVPLG